LKEGQTINFDTAVDERTGEILRTILEFHPTRPAPQRHRSDHWQGEGHHGSAVHRVSYDSAAERLTRIMRSRLADVA
jgi:hypothetical protein